MFFVTQFVEGLRAEIRAAVIMHRPEDLDTAVDLARLQEEVLEAIRRESRRPETSSSSRTTNFCSATVFPVGQPRTILAAGTRSDERMSRVEDKVAALHAIRKAKGLCYTCGERWSRDHKCGPTVQLHVVEELLEFRDSSSKERGDEEKDSAVIPNSEYEGEVCQISKEAMQGTETSGTLRLQGLIQHNEILMLVNSGSSHSFISEGLADKWTQQRHVLSPIKVKVADGGILECVTELEDCLWCVQGISFQSNFKVLPLGSYDVILGMDWLEQHSPMQINWRAKTLQFQYKQRAVCLKGVSANIALFPSITGNQVKGLVHRNAVLHAVEFCSLVEESSSSSLPTEIAQLLEEFSAVFDELQGLPPAGYLITLFLYCQELIQLTFDLTDIILLRRMRLSIKCLICYSRELYSRVLALFLLQCCWFLRRISLGVFALTIDT